MPYDPRRDIRKGTLFFNNSAQLMLAQHAQRGGSNDKAVKLEAGVLQSALTATSKKQLAKQLKCSTQTVTKRMRQLATCAFMLRKMRTEKRFEAMPALLSLMFSGVTIENMLFTLKYKYDEMSVRCISKVAGNVETSITKMLQVHLCWTALWKAGDYYIRLRARLPTSIQTLEACSIRCMRGALDGHCLMPRLADDFTRKTRMPIADKHSANTGADFSYMHEFPDQVCHKFNCFGHIEYRIAERTCDTFHNEKKGILHTGLALRFGASLARVKQGMKRANRKGFQWIDASAGPGAEADAYRAAVYAHCGGESVAGDHRKKKTEKQLLLHRKKRLWNGRFRRILQTDHFLLQLQMLQRT